MLNLLKKNKVYIKPFCAEDGTPQGALLSFRGTIRDELIRRFNDHFNIEGDHITNGGKIAPQSMLTLVGSGGGALGLSSVMAGQVFMATANPATLMALGGGYGSAVMGAGGIVAHAPFIPLAGALMPVAAPLLAFQAITTIMIMNQFKGIHERLNHLGISISRIIQRSEAAYVGEMISASNRIAELESQFGICNQFTPEMMLRIAFVEDKVNPIFERYRFLYQAQSVNAKVSVEDLNFKQNDAYFAILLSILDLRIDLLRLRLAIQEHPGYMRHSATRLIQKVEFYNALWNQIDADPKLLADIATDLRGVVGEMNWWQKSMPKWLLGARGKRVALEKNSNLFEKQSDKFESELQSTVKDAQEFGERLRTGLSESDYMNLVYWRDARGEHSYYTDDLQVVAK